MAHPGWPSTAGGQSGMPTVSSIFSPSMLSTSWPNPSVSPAPSAPSRSSPPPQQQSQQYRAAMPRATASPAAWTAPGKPAVAVGGGAISEGPSMRPHHRQSYADAPDGGADPDDQVTHLLGVVEQSQQYGRHIERSVEELAQLLHKKTVECEGLRAIARQKDDGLRQAVRNEYETRIKSESRQLQETRNLQSRIEALQVEKAQLHQEVESLRGVVSQLQQIPPPTNYSPDDHSLFNRVLRGPNVVGDEDGEQQQGMQTSSDARRVAMEREEAKNEVFATWNLPRAHAVTPAQRSLIHYVANLGLDEARALQAAGVFDFLRVVCARMCRPDADEGTFPDLPTVVGSLIRERRTGGNLEREAAQPIPTVVKNSRQRVTDIFLANNPNKFAELAKLLDDWRGREDELYTQLKREYESLGASFAAVDRARMPLANPQEASTPVELHARVILMYKKYNPEKLQSAELNEMFAKYPPEVLLSSLVAKYGPEPTAAERRELVKLICDG